MFEFLNTPYFMFGMIALVALFILAVIGLNLVRKKNKKGVYERKLFLTKNEQDCFRHLIKEFPDYIICPQVSMGAVLQPIIEGNMNDASVRSTATILRNKIGSKIIDFVFLNKSTLNVSFVIELDDKSHDFKIEQDMLRDKHLALAGIHTVRFRRENGMFPNRSKIEFLLKQSISKYTK